jgi:hypothetical protein
LALFLERAQNPRERKTERGTFALWTLAPSIYVTRCTGHLEDEHVDLLIAYSTPLVKNAPRPIEVFHEWTEMTGYAPSCRQRITTWALENRKAYARVHVSVKSKLVKMGVQVVNIALGNIVAYDTAPALQVAIRTALRAHGADVDGASTDGAGPATVRRSRPPT